MANNQRQYYSVGMSSGDVDELQYCEPKIFIQSNFSNTPKNQNQASSREKISSRRERRKNASDISLSISNNASALFTHSQIKSFNKEIQNYESIANLTQQQNDNLKEQNKYLLDRLKKMKEKEQKYSKIVGKAKQYKTLYCEACEELEMVKKQCQAYKLKAEEMKALALRDIYKLQEKYMPLRTNDDSQSNDSFAYSSPNMLSDEQDRHGINSYIAKSN